MKQYFEFCDELKFDNHEWRSYFFAEVSALAYHDGTKAKKELNWKPRRNIQKLIKEMVASELNLLTNND